jgi:hypothetical protein
MFLLTLTSDRRGLGAGPTARSKRLEALSNAITVPTTWDGRHGTRCAPGGSWLFTKALQYPGPGQVIHTTESILPNARRRSITRLRSVLLGVGPRPGHRLRAKRGSQPGLTAAAENGLSARSKRSGHWPVLLSSIRSMAGGFRSRGAHPERLRDGGGPSPASVGRMGRPL